MPERYFSPNDIAYLPEVSHCFLKGSVCLFFISQSFISKTEIVLRRSVV